MDEKEYLDEVLMIYDDNVRAIAIHISFLSTLSRNSNISSCSKKGINIQRIEKDLLEGVDLSKYKVYMKEIMNSFKGDIEKFKDLSNFEIRGIADNLYNIRNIIENDKNVMENVCLINKFENDCEEIMKESKKILEVIKDGK